MFEPEERSRYSRQLILPELGMAGQQRLKEASVLVVGAGGLGCPVLQYLVAAGIGCIGIVDQDVVDRSNLHRQILYNDADIGLQKATVALQKLQLLNPYTRLTAYPERLTTDNSRTICEPYDLVVDGSDNFPTRYLVNDACVELNKPLVFGSIFRFEGQVSVFNYRSGPNYRDLFPDPPAAGEVPNCAETGVLGVLPGMVGTLMANEAIKISCGIGEPLSGRLLTIDALGTRTRVFNYGKAPAAAAVPTPTDQPAATALAPAEISLAELEDWQQYLPEQTLLVDVREAYEFEAFNIGGINIPLYELSERLHQVPETVKQIVFCCSTGIRSRQAIRLCRPHLQAALYSLKNGISA